jgi:hypothetical protein
MTRGMCTVEDCNRPTLARRLCAMHYKRWWTHGDPNTMLLERGQTKARRIEKRLERTRNQARRKKFGEMLPAWLALRELDKFLLEDAKCRGKNAKSSLPDPWKYLYHSRSLTSGRNSGTLSKMLEAEGFPLSKRRSLLGWPTS